MNDDPGNRRISLQGFIPIVAFSGKEDGEDDKKALAKSPKRAEEDLYYNGPYPPIPIDNEEQTKSQNFFIESPDSSKTNRLGYEKAIDSVKQDRFGTRIQEVKHANNDFFISPPSAHSSQPNKDRFVIVPDKEAVRYISAEDYHKRPIYLESNGKFHPDNQKSESQGGGHFIVSSKPSKSDDDQYVPAGPYPPQPLPTNERHPAKDTTAKQYGKQYDPEGIYELQNANYILNNDGGSEEKCICVPFYLCRNGYLHNNGRSVEKEYPIDERSARKISKRSPGNEVRSVLLD